jgi:hypothetical protein
MTGAAIRSSDSPISLLRWIWERLDPPSPPAVGVVALSVEGLELAALRALASFTTKPHFRIGGELSAGSAFMPAVVAISERSQAFVWMIHFDWGTATLSKLRSGGLWMYSVGCFSKGPRFHRSFDSSIRSFWEACQAISRSYEPLAEFVRPPFGTPRKQVDAALSFRSAPPGFEQELARLLELLPESPQRVHGTAAGSISFVENVMGQFTECGEDCCEGMLGYASLDGFEDNVDHAMLEPLAELLINAPPKGGCSLWFEDFRFNHPLALDYERPALTWRLLDEGRVAKLDILDLQGDLEDDGV